MKIWGTRATKQLEAILLPKVLRMDTHRCISTTDIRLADTSVDNSSASEKFDLSKNDKPSNYG